MKNEVSLSARTYCFQWMEFVEFMKTEKSMWIFLKLKWFELGKRYKWKLVLNLFKMFIFKIRSLFTNCFVKYLNINFLLIYKLLFYLIFFSNIEWKIRKRNYWIITERPIRLVYLITDILLFFFFFIRISYWLWFDRPQSHFIYGEFGI